MNLLSLLSATQAQSKKRAKYAGLALCALAVSGVALVKTRTAESPPDSSSAAATSLKFNAGKIAQDKNVSPATVALDVTPAASPRVADAALATLDQCEFFEAESLRIMQSAEDLKKPGARERLVARLADLEQRQKAALVARAAELNVPMMRIEAGKEPGALIGFEGVKPLYLASQNVGAAVTTAASYVRQNTTFDSVFGGSVDGAGFGAGIFELYTIFDHDEFILPDSTSRVEVLDTGGTGQHATHIAGTIGAEGKDPTLKGMAPAVKLYSWVQESASKYASRAIPFPGGADMVVTNTSLASTGGGRYTSADQSRDEWAALFPYTVMFQCAGNTDGAYESILGTTKEAKNHIVVGNVVDVSRNAAGAITGSTYIIGSSARGPTDDGRIKPDIIANGYFVKSTANAATGSVTLSGTSMSTPNAAGSAILLQDYFSKRFPGHLLRSDTLKALIAHSADDRGTAGPDYTWGYGIMNVHGAAKVIKDYADNPASQRIIHAVLNNTTEHAYTFTWDGTSPIKVTLAWLDPVGPASAYDDDRTPALVNDLDVTVTSPLGTVNYPWTMPYVVNGYNAADFATAAIKGVNTVDNLESLLISAPSEAGTYTIKVKHTGTLSGGSQSYSLVHSGFTAPVSAPAPVVTSWTDLGGGWVEITGQNFLQGADAARVYGDTLLVPGEHMQVSATRIVCKFASAPMAAGNLVVTNPDNQTAGVALAITASVGGIVLNAFESSWTYTQTFDSLTLNTAASETWLNDVTTDTTNGLKGWYAAYFLPDGSTSATSPTIRAGSGTADTARLYSFGASGTATDRAFGNFRKDDVISYGGSIRQGVRFVNQTGQTLTGFHLQFKGEQWRNGGNTVVNTMAASYAIFGTGAGNLLDGAPVYTPLVTFTAPINGGSVTALDGNAAANSTLLDVEIEDISWAPGQELWIRWVTPNHAYVDDAVAIDDLVFTAWPTTTP